MQCNPRSHDDRHGVTLLELLIVITIMMIAAAVAIPKLRPAIEGRQVREAARSIVVYLASARTRAIETGRPYGVVIQRMPENPQAGTIFQQVEIPPPYSGESYDSRVRIVWTGLFNRLSGGYVPGSVSMQYGLPVVHVAPLGGMSPKTFRPWDKIQFNNQGPWYTILPPLSIPDDKRTPGLDDTVIDSDGYVDVTNPFRAMVDMPPNTPHLWPMPIDSSQPSPYNYSYYDRCASGPMSFTIVRQPYLDPDRPSFVSRRSATAPLHLPRNVAVDLSVSGTDSEPLAFHQSASDLSTVSDPDISPSPVLIIFSPNGSVDQIYYQDTMSRVIDPVFLLVGERERTNISTNLPSTVPSNWIPPDDQLPNWVNPINRWVTLQSQTGKVSVSKGAMLPTLPAQGNQSFNWKNPMTWKPHVRAVRQFARSAEGEGGR